MRQMLSQLVNRHGGPLWRLLGWLIPKDAQRIAVNSFPDFDDTTRALVLALRETGGRLSVLTARRDAPLPEWLSGVKVAVAYRYSLRGLWLYHRAKFVLFTHGCFSAWTPSGCQVVVNVWHGMPLKRIGLLDETKRAEDLPRFHLTLATDARFQEIMAAAFGVPRERVLIAEHPRLDILRAGVDGSLEGLPVHDRLVVWLPTYRASVVGDVRVDGDESASIFSSGADLARIDALCTKHRVLCIIKPHPMAKVTPESFTRYRNLVLMNDAGLAARGLSLYQLLGQAHLLITDVSSVYFDYKVLGRPVVLYCPDLKQYAATRGFVAPIETLVDDPIVEDEEALLTKLEACFGAELQTQPITAGTSTSAPATRSLLRQIGMHP